MSHCLPGKQLAATGTSQIPFSKIFNNSTPIAFNQMARAGFEVFIKQSSAVGAINFNHLASNFLHRFYFNKKIALLAIRRQGFSLIPARPA
jgi:hypothetical protein